MPNNAHVPQNQTEDKKVAGSPQPTEAMPALSPGIQAQVDQATQDGMQELPQPEHGVQLPSVSDLVKQVEAGEYPPQAPAIPQHIPGHIDVAAFLRAQHTFLEVQSWFFSTSHNGHYEQALLTYSKAQAAYISAQSQVLKQLGVV